jgi:glycosyltransferase involved in cell wall biosynthesis
MGQLKILWVKVGGLWPVDRGGRRRSFEIVRALAARHQVTLLTTHGSDEEAAGLRAALAPAECVSVPARVAKQGSAGFAAALARSWLSELPVDLWRWRIPALCDAVAERVADADVCVADFLASAPNLPADPRAKVILFEHNVEHQIWRRLAAVEERPLRRALLELEWRKMRRYEARVVARAHRTIAVSEADRDLLAAAAPGADVRAVATGVDTGYFHANGVPEEPDSVVFVGAMDWYPNEDGALHFAERVLPLVRAEVPAVRFTVVGRNPGPRVRALAPDVRITGTVDDVRPFLDAAAVVVVPLRVGGGTRLKIFEALSMGKALVSTTVGAEGLPVRAGREVELADEPAAFAATVAALLRDRSRRQELGAAGRQLVEERYTWAAVARDFERELEGGPSCA